MRAAIRGVAIDCYSCQHWAEETQRWCMKHDDDTAATDTGINVIVHGATTNQMYCSDFELPEP